MSVAVLKVPPQFPVGTNVAAYPDTGQQPSGPPAVTAIETKPVDANSIVTYTTLQASTRYWAGASISGVWLYFEFTTPSAAVGLIGLGDLAFDVATQTELDREVGILDLHPKNFGAIGDGVANDTVALQAWLDAIPQYGTGRITGQYLFSSLSSATDHITIEGNGRLITTMTNDNVTNAVWLSGAGVVWDGPTIETQNPITPFARAAGGNLSNGNLLILGAHALPAADTCTIKSGTFKGAYGAAFDIRNAKRAIARDIRSSDSCGNGASFTNCTEQVILDGFQIERCGDDIVAVVCDTTVPSGTKNATIVNGTGKDGDAKGVAFTGVDGGFVDNVEIENTYTFGVAVFQDGFFGLGMSHRVKLGKVTLRRCGYKFGSTPANLHSSASAVPNAINIGPGTHGVEVSRDVSIYDCYGIGVSVDTPPAPTTTTASRTFPAATDVPVTDASIFSALGGSPTVFLTDGTSTKFSYTGKTGNTLTGVTGGFGTFASGSRVMTPTERIGIHCAVEGAGGAGVQVGDPSATDYIRFLQINLDGVRTKRTVGGVILGGITGCQMVGFDIASYKQGASGSRRGLLYGRMRDFNFGMGRVFNDDGGDEKVATVGNNQHVDQWNVAAYAPADA